MDDDSSSVVSTGPYVYEDPWEAADSDKDDDGVYTNSEGTIRILERDISSISVLEPTANDNQPKGYGLRMIVLARIGQVKSVWKPDLRITTQSTHFRFLLPLRPFGPNGEEREILLNDGESWDIDVLAPAYAPDATFESVQPYTWNIEGCFHPNWVVWKRQVSDDSFRISSSTGTNTWSTAVGQLFFPVDNGFQRAGLTLDKSVEFPTGPVTVHGYGVGDPTQYQWEDEKKLPTWLDSKERTATMGFLKMTTRFNTLSSKQDYSSKLPGTGNHPFHVLLYWPRSAKFLRDIRWASKINQGGYLQVKGRTYHFIGKMIGFLRTSLLCDVPLGVFIPVIIPEQVSISGAGDGGSGSGTFSTEFKPRTTPKKTVQGFNASSPDNPGAVSASGDTSPSASRGASGGKRGSAAIGLQKRKLDAMLGGNAPTNAGRPASANTTVGSRSAGVVGANVQLESSVTHEHTGDEDLSDHVDDTPPSSQPTPVVGEGRGGTNGVEDAAPEEDTVQSDDEPVTRGKRTTRSRRGGMSAKAAGKRRAGARR